MKFFDNVTNIVRDDMTETITRGSRVSIAAACFSMYAYNELKKQLEGVDELRFIFTSPTFVTEKESKQKREFYIPKHNREQSLYGTEFEIKLRNEMTQKAIAKECADWIRRKATFKSNTTGENMGGFMTVEGQDDYYTYMPFNGFTTVDIGCERGNNAYNIVNRLENPVTKEYLKTFEAIWSDKDKLQDVTETVIENIATAYNENSPELIYFITLFNVFNEFLEDISEDVLPNEATGFKNSKIWGMLYDFQRDAVLAIINKLEKFNGCIPECLNLVFFKKVMSKAKFWQMIGRGTRLCPGLRDGEDKDRFYIFDFCGNFEFFRMSDGKPTALQIALQGAIFSLKAQIVFKLQELEYQTPELIAFRKTLVEDLVRKVQELNKENFAVRQHLKYVEFYSNPDRCLPI